MLESLFNKDWWLATLFITGSYFWKIWVFSIHTRFTEGLLQLQNFHFYWESFLKLIKFITQSDLLLLNLFLFLSTFSVFLNDYFFRWLAYKFVFSRFSVLTNYILWSYNFFSVSSCFSCFSWFRIFWVWVQGVGPGLRSSPTIVRIFSYVEEKMWR